MKNSLMCDSGFSKSLHVLQDETFETMSPFLRSLIFKSLHVYGQPGYSPSWQVHNLPVILPVSFCNCVICVFSWRVGVNALLAGPAPSLPYWASERPQRAFNAPLLYSSALLMYLYICLYLFFLLYFAFFVFFPEMHLICSCTKFCDHTTGATSIK